MPASDSSPDVQLEQLAAEFVQRHRRGECPSLGEYTARYPALAADIRDLFPALVQIENLKPVTNVTGPFELRPDASVHGPLERLGDYRIVQEVGRGGMGIVYEAEQESLGRHVALKVLPASDLLNPTFLERFRREARAAAQLHHTNIVPVFGVGEAQGFHYYAMQFIRGEGLDKVLADVRRLRQPTIAGGSGPASEGSVAHNLVTGKFAAAPPGSGEPKERLDRSGATSRLTAGGPEAEYYRGVARIGVQVAEALTYAHRQGVLHRDIKPSNLLLDLQGTVWITDFGLAKTEGTDGLTQTGDIVGTIRYMAPERFEGQSLPQSDVYGLGLTLYELLTLRPAFDDTNKARLIEKALRQPPPALRKLDRHIPRDLETIVLKCLAKEPRERYSSAADLAEDLRRFLADRPIRARRATAAEQVWRWCRRNRTAALLILVSLAALVSLGVLLTAFSYNARLTDRNARLADALKEADRQQQTAEQLLYVNRITLAGREWSDCNIGRAKQLLEECPEKRRGWEWHFLKRHCNLELATLPVHLREFYSVAFSPDGRLLACGGLKPVLTLWDAQTYEPRGSRDGPEELAIRCVVFSPDGRFLAAGYYTGTVRVWDASGRRVAELHLPHGGQCRLAFSPRGEHLAAGNWSIRPGGSHEVVVWDTVHWEKRHILRAQGKPNLAVAFDPEGKQLLAVFGSSTKNAGKTTDAHFQAWNLADGTLSQEFGWPVQGAAQAAISPDGRWLATSDSDGTIRLWDRPAGKEVRTFTAHTGTVMTRLAFSPDSRRLASCGDDRSIRLWDVAGGRQLGVLRGHEAWVNGVAFHPDGRRLASAADDGTVKIWDTQNVLESRHLPGLGDLTSCVLLSGDGRWFLVQADESPRRETLWDAQSQRKVVQYPVNGWGFVWWQPHPASLSPDGTWFTRPGQDEPEQQPRGTRVWDVRSGKLHTVLQDPAGRPAGRAIFDPAGQHLAVLLRSQPERQLPPAVQLWDLATDRPVWTHPAAEGRFHGLAFTPDGRRLAALWLPGDPARSSLVLLDAATGQLIRTIPNRAAILPPLVFAPAGNLLACTAAEAGTVQLVDPETGAAVHSSLAHRWHVTALAFSPDGTRLASGSHDHTLKIWDTATGQETLTLSGHRSPVTSVRFSPDGHRLTSCDLSGEVRTWDGTPLPASGPSQNP